MGDFGIGDFGIGDFDLGDFNLGDFDLTPAFRPTDNDDGQISPKCD